MNAVEDYAKRWAKREREELDTLTEWVQSIKRYWNPELETLNIKYVPSILLCSVNQKWWMNWKKIHEEYVLVPADKAGNNIVFFL
jgi:hypothetical protein